MAKVYDVCIIGAGINGSSAAFSLSNTTTNNVLLLEQFPVPHTRGSSHGQSRIIRCSYEDQIYSHMTHNAFAIWKDVEAKVGERLLIQNGMLDIFDKHSDEIDKYILALNSVGSSYDILTGDEINTRFPLFKVPANCSAIYEPGGGMLLASKCVAALQKIFVHNGGTFNDSETVLRIIPGDIVTVETSKTEYKAKSVIIAAGSYTSKLTASLGLNLPLRVERTHPLYWQLDNHLTGSVASNFPSFIGNRPQDVYGVASYEYPGHIKICSHSGPVVDPENPDVAGPLLCEVKQFISKYMNGIVCNAPSIIETCFYTNTPDHHFIIDVHPRYKNIVIGAGFSGHGFKMAPVTGNILADLAIGRVPSYDLSMFRIGRFKNVVSENSKL